MTVSGASRAFTVYQLNQYLKESFDQDLALANIPIRGEIADFKWHRPSGHLYFSLMDQKSIIRCVMFKDFARHLAFEPENGMAVVLIGSVSVYVKTGQYQIYGRNMFLEGAGALYSDLELLKNKLNEKGYFKEENKKPLPAFPKTVAVITSGSGAAIRDIIDVAGRRNKSVQLAVFPTLVQGVSAPKSIAGAIRLANRWKKADCIILGRGGGSSEDLSAFNSELVADAIFQSKIPVVSAVGHETDYSISDFVADLRAPTPSAAAELVVPELEGIYAGIEEIKYRMIQAVLDILDFKLARTEQISRKPVFSKPEYLYRQRVERIEYLREKISREYQHLIDKKEMAFLSVLSTLEAVSPLNVLKRGYSVVYGKNKQIIKNSSVLSPGEQVTIQFSEGWTKAVILHGEEKEKF